MKQKRLLAFDLGASNGRAVLGAFDGKRIALTEIHRFDNPMIEQNGLYYWDALGLYRQLKESFLKLRQEGLEADCFGIDTWGVTLVLIDKNGALLGNPAVFATVRRRACGGARGDSQRVAQILTHGTCQLRSIRLSYLRPVKEGTPLWGNAETLLFCSPYLYGYYLT
jgi:rhamnulokinase/L-fuculokinase